jgi:hypothetical protein
VYLLPWMPTTMLITSRPAWVGSFTEVKEIIPR